jgi:hypothetical protein
MPQRKETAEQAATFEAYYAMGGDRSLLKLSRSDPVIIPDLEKMPSFGTLKKWSRFFHWQERIVIKDKAVAAGVDKRTTKAAIDRRAKWLARIEARIDSAFDEQGKPKFDVVEYRDLNDTVKLALLLLGEPEHQEVEHRGEIKFIQVREVERED